MTGTARRSAGSGETRRKSPGIKKKAPFFPHRGAFSNRLGLGDAREKQEVCTPSPVSFAPTNAFEGSHLHNIAALAGGSMAIALLAGGHSAIRAVIRATALPRKPRFTRNKDWYAASRDTLDPWRELVIQRRTEHRNAGPKQLAKARKRLKHAKRRYRQECPSAEERSDVSTRAQCRGQGAEISTRRSAAEQRR